MRARKQIIFVLFFASISLLMAAPSFSFPSSRDTNTDRTVFVHLFEWKWKDVARECETFLGPKGFGAVQVSPPNEHAVLKNYPWYQRYQPVSYELVSRSGTRSEFIDMVKRCKASGVSVYVDAVINHMAWVNRTGQTRFGIGGTPFDEYSYGTLYGPADFHRCGRNGDDTISNYQDRWEVQSCNLASFEDGKKESLADLKTENEKVRSTIASYLNDLLNIGVAGFRIDAAKHMPAVDLQAIFSKVQNSFYDYQEVIDFGGEPVRSEEYFQTGDVSEFRYGRKLAEIFTRGKLAWLANFGTDWGMLPTSKAVVFLDNHDNQRGHGAGGEVLTHKNGQKYSLASAFMLAWPYGYPSVISSYRFSDPSAGPPSDNAGNTKSVYVNGLSSCGQEWICEHRWPTIANMVSFRNFTRTARAVSKWWSNGNNAIAFGRGDKGFIVLNGEPTLLKRWFDTGLPAGTYVDVISGSPIEVNQQGWAEITVNSMMAAAIHGGHRINH